MARRPQKRLEWSFGAARDVLQIEAWIALDNVIAGLEVAEHIIGKAELLRRNPIWAGAWEQAAPGSWP